MAWSVIYADYTVAIQYTGLTASTMCNSLQPTQHRTQIFRYILNVYLQSDTCVT